MREPKQKTQHRKAYILAQYINTSEKFGVDKQNSGGKVICQKEDLEYTVDSIFRKH